jgi:hypothetical protein
VYAFNNLYAKFKVKYLMAELWLIILCSEVLLFPHTDTWIKILQEMSGSWITAHTNASDW